jgi:hypothetical protein
MEILAALAVCVAINALCMAWLMRWRALHMRGWHITGAEALLLQVRASLSALLCVLVALAAFAWLPQAEAQVLLAVCLPAYFVPYYLRLLRLAYLLTKTQKDRGRGVARGNIRGIVQSSFGLAFAAYGMVGGGLYFIWWLATRA